MRFFLRRHSGVGISLDETRIEMVRVQGDRGLEVVAHAVIPFAPNVYENGRVYDGERFATELRHAFEANHLPKKGVTVSLPSSVSFLRMLAMPNVQRKQMKALLQFQLQDEIRLPIANPIYDFDYYPAAFQAAANGPAATGEADQAWILLVAVPRDLIEGLASAFREAGIRLSAVEVKGISVLRALKAIGKLPEQAAIVAEFGAERVDVHLYQKGGLLTTRSLDAQAEDYIARHPDRGLQEVAAAREGENRNRFAVGNGGPPNGRSRWYRLDGEAVGADLDAFARDLSLQLQRSISFMQYSLKQRELAIDRLFLTGHVPNPERLAENVRNQLNVPVEILQVSSVPQTGHRQPIVSLSAAGAALRGGIPDGN